MNHTDRVMNLLNEAGHDGAGWYEGWKAGVTWASETRPHSLVNGCPAHLNIKQSGFPNDDYASGYWRGVVAAWCSVHPTAACWGSHACLREIRERD